MKESFYFSHDHYARHDKKMVTLLMNEGVSGIGVYWCIVEMLYEEGGKLPLSDSKRIAFELNTDEATVTRVINSDLFVRQSECFYSESVFKRLQYRKEISEKAANNAKKRWGNATAMRPHCEGNALNKSKVNKSKVNNNMGVQAPTPAPSEDSSAKRLCDYTKTLYGVNEMKMQMTLEEAQKLIDKYPKQDIMDILERMSNYPKLKSRNNSVYATANKWLTTDQEKKRQQVAQQKSNVNQIGSDNFSGLTAN